jgi:hypothetical protein
MATAVMVGVVISSIEDIADLTEADQRAPSAVRRTDTGGYGSVTSNITTEGDTLSR